MAENELILESSPYLRAHAHNPVNWYSWGPKALDKARVENKLMVISIGYSACHWCHVMEKESFEDLEVAQIMNKDFINIKVDREERPDIDQIYMEAVQIMTGQGGWPLHCITLPNGEPIYGGTYFRKEDWKNILNNLASYWKKNELEAINYGKNLRQELQTLAIGGERRIGQLATLPTIPAVIESWIPYLDYLDGGFRGAPKFPLPNAWLFLMEMVYGEGGREMEKLMAFFHLTLVKMLSGGIYDQIGGGFARYSTDNHWFLPHFEKMLYDNAQLISLYALAFGYESNAEYERVVRETVKFLLLNLKSEEGGYYSALDADSEGVEGKYYVWTDKELESILGSDASIFSHYYNVQPGGNWEGSNILYRSPNGNWSETLNSNWGLTEVEWTGNLSRYKSILLAHRRTRVSPALDDKILCSWNALLIKAFCDAYRAFEDPEYLVNALQIVEFIETKMMHAEGLYRTYKNGVARIDGFLDDYAFLADAMIHLYQVSFQSEWIYKAARLVDKVMDHFSDPDSPLFYYYDARQEALIVRKKEIHDSVIPCSNSVLAHVFYSLGHYLDKPEFEEISDNMLLSVSDQLTKYSPSFSNWSRLAISKIRGIYEISILGPEADHFRRGLEKMRIVHKQISGLLSRPSTKSVLSILPILRDKVSMLDSTLAQTWIIICRNKVCSPPFKNLEEVKEWMETST